MATLTEALSEVRSLIDEPIAQFWTDAELTNWINQGCQDFAQKTRTLRDQTNVAVTALTQKYLIPAEYLAVYRVQFVPTSAGQVFIYPLEFSGYNEMDQQWGVYQTFPAAWPQSYTLWNNPSSAPAYTITHVTTAMPGVVTTSATNTYATGDTVTISGVLGATQANGRWTVTVIDGTHFSLNNSDVTGTYVSGGTVQARGLQITLFPTPDQAGVLNVFGYRRSVDVVSGSDILDVVPPYEEAIYEYAAYKAKRKDKDTDWQSAKGRYEELVSDAIDGTGWYTDQANTFTSGQAQWPPWAFGGGSWG